MKKQWWPLSLPEFLDKTRPHYDQFLGVNLRFALPSCSTLWSALRRRARQQSTLFLASAGGKAVPLPCGVMHPFACLGHAQVL